MKARMLQVVRSALRLPARLRDKGAALRRLKGRLKSLVRELGELRGQQLDDLTNAIHALRREQAQLLEHVFHAPRRAAAEARLRSGLEPPPVRTDGVSMLLACRNAGGLLRRATLGALAALDELLVPGEVFILDDASRDDTPAILGGLAKEDPRIRFLTSEQVLGYARARNVLLGQARHRHALFLDADHQLLRGGVAALYDAARRTGAVLTSGTVLGVPFGEGTDQLSLVEVGALLELGGFDPEGPGALTEGELVRRLLRRDLPVTMVPVPVGIGSAEDLAKRPQVGANRPCWHDNSGPRIYHSATGLLGPGAARTTPADAVPPGPRLLTISTGGNGDFAEDAVLLAALERLQRVRPGCVPVVVTDGDAPPPLGRLAVWGGTTAELCQGLARQAFPVLAFPSFDTLWFTAASLRAEEGLLARWQSIATAAQENGLPYLVTSQVCRAAAADTRGALARFIAGASRFGVRDRQSLQWLREHGLAGSNVSLSGDDGLGIRPEPSHRVRDRLARLNVPTDRPLLGFQVGVPGGGSRSELLEIARQVDEAAAGMGHVVVGLAVSARGPMPDVEWLTGLLNALRGRRAPWFLLEPGPNAAAVAGLVKACAAVVADNSAVARFALERNIPAILLVHSEGARSRAETLLTCFQIPGPLPLAASGQAGSIAPHLERMRRLSWSAEVPPAAVDGWLDQALSGGGPLRLRAA